MSPTDRAAQQIPSEMIRAAFHELHGSRLHGFALLLTLGDRPAAARLAADALADGSARTPELSHPERAAAWLRARVLDRYRAPRRDRGPAPSDRVQAVAELGVTEAVLSGLAALDARERAALIAGTLERLDPRDVATIVRRDGRRLERLLVRARRRYLLAFEPPAGDFLDRGPIAQRLRAAAARALT